MKRAFRIINILLFIAPITGAGAIQTQNSRSNSTSIRENEIPRSSDSQSSRAFASSARSSRASTGPVSLRPLVGGVQSSRAATVRKNSVLTRAGATPISTKSTTGSVRKNNQTTNVSRAGTSRATAVFSDVSKMGGGYAACREAFNTCMDQFCAGANDTYRRCICSDKFREFKDSEDGIAQAKILLQQFNDNNLNAVDKTSAEVGAMYSASIGEAAIKKDTSSSAAVLSEIGDLLSGKKKASDASKLDFSASLDFSMNMDDVWGGESNSWETGGKNLQEMEGITLYNEVNRQCSELSKAACETETTMTMVRSAYGILIGQDCNAYGKKVDTQKEAVLNTVREANKVLRDARLDEYRSHNSADVNECMDKVKTAVLGDNACGTDYKKCMDPTGMYIDVNTGDAIYSPKLFGLPGVIKLEGGGDILQQNQSFDKYLDSKKMFASTALDGCRDISAAVWTEFKRSAIIEIAQAQDVRIEDVKMSCVTTMKECYDTQGGALKAFDDTTSKTAGALSAIAARAMCQDKVLACAVVYSDSKTPSDCGFDSNGNVTGKNCGLKALLSFVNNVDNTRIAEGCESAIENYVADLCKPAAGDSEHKMPWGCRLYNKNGDDGLSELIQKFAVTNCADPSASPPQTTFNTLPSQIKASVEQTIGNLFMDLGDALQNDCAKYNGVWLKAGMNDGKYENNPAFYSAVYGTSNATNTELGSCLQYAPAMQCEEPGVVCDAGTGKIEYSEDFYKYRCSVILMGIWDSENKTCLFK